MLDTDKLVSGQVPRSRLLRKWRLSCSFFKGPSQPLSSVPVWAEPSQSLIGMWPPVRFAHERIVALTAAHCARRNRDMGHAPLSSRGCSTFPLRIA
jgi:hypothetical protein